MLWKEFSSYSSDTTWLKSISEKELKKLNQVHVSVYFLCLFMTTNFFLLYVFVCWIVLKIPGISIIFLRTFFTINMIYIVKDKKEAFLFSFVILLTFTLSKVNFCPHIILHWVAIKKWLSASYDANIVVIFLPKFNVDNFFMKWAEEHFSAIINCTQLNGSECF